MVDDSDYSSSEDSDSSEDLANDRIWTCDDIYPSKGMKPYDSDDSSDDDSSSDESFSKPVTTRTPFPIKSNAMVSDSDDDDEDDDSSDDDDAPPTETVGDRREQMARAHSSREIEVTLTAQSAALEKVKEEEEARRTQLEVAKTEFAKENARALDVSRHIDDELSVLSKEYESSDDDAIKAIEEKLEAKRNSSESSLFRAEEKAKFERRNMEREMRLAKARERIEKKKDEEAANIAQERMKAKDGNKLDMSKAARVERAYSWYSRMAMPTREKMKERVEFMPASSGVTPDDVDLLPWNARGTFVSVAAMMRINRTSASTGGIAKKTSASDSDSD
jgi:hypothetical protein